MKTSDTSESKLLERLASLGTKPKSRRRKRSLGVLTSERPKQDSGSGESPKNSDSAKSIHTVLQSTTIASQPRESKSIGRVRYQTETLRPILCLAFVLPLLMIYEWGALVYQHESLRSGIDQWLYQLMDGVGLGYGMLLPMMTIGVLLIWHHRNRDHWRIRGCDLFYMAIETVGVGLILFWVARGISLLTGPNAIESVAYTLPVERWPSLMTCIGSGIYEELIFRIGLLGAAIWWAGKLIDDPKIAGVVGVFAVSLIFSAVHYQVFNPAGGPFELSSFAFRFFASTVFCVLFLFRGFGIAVGVHVAYDVLTHV